MPIPPFPAWSMTEVHSRALHGCNGGCTRRCWVRRLAARVERRASDPLGGSVVGPQRHLPRKRGLPRRRGDRVPRLGLCGAGPRIVGCGGCDVDVGTRARSVRPGARHGGSRPVRAGSADRGRLRPDRRATSRDSRDLRRSFLALVGGERAAAGEPPSSRCWPDRAATVVRNVAAGGSRRTWIPSATRSMTAYRPPRHDRRVLPGPGFAGPSAVGCGVVSRHHRGRRWVR